jgi:4-amino-4-deoxy-L-arabinose transferase-like glycosyltransferase
MPGLRRDAPIVLIYLVVATLFAVYTPAWQVPDEPAHYNYVRHLALGHGLPMLRPGDYCQPCLDALTSARFPPGMPVDALQYEFHQPPLYYLLAVPIFLLFGGALLPLRLFSVALGAVLVLLTVRIVERALADVAPGTRQALALGTAAFVALLPQHVAMLSGVNNDALAEVLLAALLFALLPAGGAAEEMARGERATANAPARSSLASFPYSGWAPAGVLLGLGLWTKATDYMGVGLVVLAAALAYWQARGTPRKRAAWRGGARALAIAAIIALPWWLRNTTVYGGLDFLGMQYHNLVAIQGGQTTTAQWLAAFGLPEVLRRMVVTTTQSFWGQFGWMGVVLDARIYFALVLLGALGVWGLLLHACDGRRLARLPQETRMALVLLGALAVFAAATYAWYNLTFVQHQGRYLYPGLIPAGLGLVAGWRRVQRSTRREALGGAVWLALAGAAWYALAGLDMPRWAILLWAAVAALAGLGPIARRRLPAEAVLAALVAVALAAFALVALFVFVVPALTP